MALFDALSCIRETELDIIERQQIKEAAIFVKQIGINRQSFDVGWHVKITDKTETIRRKVTLLFRLVKKNCGDNRCFRNITDCAWC